MGEMKKAKIRRVKIQFETWIAVPPDYEYKDDDLPKFDDVATERMKKDLLDNEHDGGEWEVWTDAEEYEEVEKFDLTWESLRNDD